GGLGHAITFLAGGAPAARALTKMATKGAPCQCLYPAIPIRIVDISEQDVHPRPVRSAIGGKTVPLPDFLIAGVPKAGTTALHAVQEPKPCLTDGPPTAGDGPGDAETYREHVWRRADYEALFAEAPPGTPAGESTPFYLYDLAAQRRIRAAVPGVKLIISLR